ncbi:BMP family ABC transporter substrate-binding protein [Mesomycoplasma conjunctivae]|uniref:BMP family ABC transporter substrate-binding protein n=1 Tax=Mesomycoplasma conjunctivae TaxID=45361 RepID=UPI003DA2FD27
MKKIKKFFGLGLLVPLSGIALVACGTPNNQTPSKPKEGTTQDQGTGFSQPAVDKLAQDNKAKIETAAQDNNKHFKTNFALVTADGTVFDGSFNQSSFEAIKKFVSLTKDNAKQRHIDSATANLSQTYTSLLVTEANVWVLSGFQHGNAIETWLKQGNNLESFKTKNIIIIGIDWAQATESSIPNGRMISIQYNVEEGAWIAGYAAADFLAAKYPNDENKRKLTSFGGGDFPAVTDFIVGFLTGVKAYNEENESKKTKVSSSTIDLTTGFNASSAESVTKISSISNAGDPTIIFPVAGPQTQNVLNAIKGKSDKYVIGVDVDQSKTFKGAGESEKFFTSVEKGLGTSIFQVATALFTKENNSKLLGGFQFNSKNGVVKLGYHDLFTNVSPNALTGDDKTLAEASIKKAVDKFKELTNSKESEVKTTLKITTAAPGQGSTILSELIQEINK